MTDPTSSFQGIIRAEGDRSIAAQNIAAATVGDHSPIVNLEPGTLKAAAEVELRTRMTNLPQAPSAVFVGREDALATMAESLSGASARVAVGQVIHGMGGVGKSELARQYAAGHPERYRLVWWIPATGEEKINAGLASLAERLHPPLPRPLTLSTALGVEEAAHWALSWLQAHDDWLLVLDNVENPKHVSKPLAQLRNGHIIITTRRQVAWPSDVIRLPLDPLTKDAAVKLIALTGERAVDPRERPVLEALAKDLGRLPLALEQAGAYIRESRISPGEYRRLLADHPSEMYDTSREEGDPERTIARLWNAHLDVIRARDPHAEGMLRVLACYAPEDIPRHIIGGAASGDGLQVINTLRLLASYHLIKLEEQTVTMHRLLQKVIVAAEEDHVGTAPEGRSSPRTALGWLAEAWATGKDLSPHEWINRNRMLSPHVESLIRHYPLTPGAGEHDGIFLAAADLECRRSNYHRAESLARHVTALMSVNRGEEHPDTLLSRTYLANALYSLERFQEAEAEHRTVWQACHRTLGEDHPATLSSRSNRAYALWSLGRFEEASTEHLAVLNARRHRLGETHPATMHSWFSVLQMLGVLTRSCSSGRGDQVLLEELRKASGEDNPDTEKVWNSLTKALEILEQFQKAVAYYHTMWQVCHQMLGEDHPATQKVWNSLTKVSKMLGRFNPAGESE